MLDNHNITPLKMKVEAKPSLASLPFIVWTTSDNYWVVPLVNDITVNFQVRRQMEPVKIFIQLILVASSTRFKQVIH